MAVEDLFGLVGQRLADKYLVESTVAQGGFGLVYRARHASLNKALAIKVLMIPDDLSEAAQGVFMKMFLQEAEMIAQLDHPAIVRVLDSGVSPMPAGGEAPWMVLDWIDGETLDDSLKARRGRGGRTPEEALLVMRPIFEALAYAHDQGVAHRDIKPANMMLPARPQGSRPSRHGLVGIRLLDFGIAKVMESDEQAGGGRTRTRSKHQAFSPLYAAPEQVGGARTGPWTDVHALALILTELLIDERAFTARDQTELFGHILSPTRPTPGARGVDVGAWEPVLQRALALRPADRFETAGEFLSALEEELPGARHHRIGPVVADTVPASGPHGPAIAPTMDIPGPPGVQPQTRGSVGNVKETSTLRPSELATSPPAPRRWPVVVGSAGLGLLVGVLALVGYAWQRPSSGESSASPHAAGTCQ